MLDRRRLLTSGFLASAGLVASSVSGRAAEAPRAAGDGLVVDTAEGSLRGIPDGDLVQFRGIRYAEPSRRGRFGRAEPLRPWTGTRSAVSLGAQCPQINPDTKPWLDASPMDEDCYFLNICAPRSGTRLPVMVWLHGGGYWWGSGGASIYDAANIVRKGEVIVVSLNHRLNAFGFLYLGGLDARYADAANLGLLDIVEALRWIKRNIASFGGDPDNVTLFGQSGGSGKTAALLAMPAARGLLNKAVMQSGPLLQVRSEEAATVEARALMAEIGLAPSEIGKLARMPAAKLVAAYQAILERAGLWDFQNLPFAPTISSASLPWQPTDARATALSAGVPAIVGSVVHETAWLLAVDGGIPAPASDDELVAVVRSHFPAASEGKIRAMMSFHRELKPESTRQELLVVITSRMWMGDDAVTLARTRAAACNAPTYLYTFDWRDPMFGGMWAAHAVEVPFLFDHLDEPHVMDDRGDIAGDRARADSSDLRFHLRDAMIAAWTGFAKTGSPATKLLPAWPAVSGASPARMRFDRVSSVELLVPEAGGPSRS